MVRKDAASQIIRTEIIDEEIIQRLSDLCQDEVDRRTIIKSDKKWWQI
jgi:hypothetical protein